jgi:N-acetylmuramoyl-L-alanine amidase/Phage tail lysozyme
MALPPLKWLPSPNFSDRSSRVDLIVVHDTEGSYSGAVSWFQKPESQVSAHYVLREDGGEATQMVALDKKAWACVAFNSRSVNIEMAGFAAKGYGSAEWDAMAEVAAFLLHFLQIPCRWAAGGVGPGFCSHFDLGAAGGGHTDPTTDAVVWESFVDLAKQEYAKGSPPSWEPQSAAPMACSLTPVLKSTLSMPPPAVQGGGRIVYAGGPSGAAPPPDLSASSVLITERDGSFRQIPVGVFSAVTIAGLPVWPPPGDIFFVRAAQVYNAWRDFGVSIPFAIAMLTQAEFESAFYPTAIGDGGTAWNLYQWHLDRAEAIYHCTGGDVRTETSMKRIVAAAWWEMTNVPAYIKAKAVISGATRASDASSIACRLYEGAGAADAAERRALGGERWSVWIAKNGSFIAANPAV